MPTDEQVIELSVEETNKLRAKLGLAPLRTSPINTSIKDGNNIKTVNDGGEEVLEMSVEETNALRSRLGLPPLRTGGQKNIEHAPAENEAEKKEALERIERAKLKRQVEQGIASRFGGNSLTDAKDSAKSWAQKMRESKTAKANNESSAKDKKETVQSEYDESDLKGMNVAHSLNELQDGSTTVLTLADAPILKTRDDTSQKILGLNENEDIDLENVNLAEQRAQEQGLREKRKLEMGMGRAGGYAGFDDDEFEELGGTQAPTLVKRSGIGAPDEKKMKKRRGFRIGDMLEEQEEQLESDLFAGTKPGQQISLEPAKADVAASDFMTTEEDEALREERKKKKKEKDGKFKKSKKKDKKKKKKNKRREIESDEDEGDEQPVTNSLPKKGLLEELEETAAETSASVGPRKRRRLDDDEAEIDKPVKMEVDEETKPLKDDKRAKYELVMAKGNERARQAFQPKQKATASDATFDEEPDDAFLNAALAKARRLNRLKEISGSNKTGKSGADAVADALQKVKQEESSETTNNDNKITFSVDETREFTRALRARNEQAEREQARKAAAAKKEAANVVSTEGAAGAEKDSVQTVNEQEEKEEDVDIQELAKEVKVDDNIGGGLEGTTGTTVPLGRGLGNMLSLLKQSGEMTRKNAGKEEMRGRAKDKRTYEDYEPLNLKEVVRIDDKKAHSKDRELANREVKLEYRDKHGRLLTRKEAFRDLCYQFHGYGSGKRKEEKKLKEIEREQAQQRLASRQAAEGGAAGTFGALKATQEATGKAFVVHKTS